MAINLIRKSPLNWPEGWSRTPLAQRNPRRLFTATTVDVELQELRGELGRLGVDGDVIISTNKRGDIDEPNDKGVAIYYVLNGRRQCMPCDLWGSIAHNLHAINLSIAAIRGLERWGSRQVVDAALAGFMALPAPGKATARPWWVVLGVDQGAGPATIKAAYSVRARVAHPDMGGTQSAMAELNAARDEALSQRQHA